jgi:long-chain fatty acid transport protein
MVGSLYPAAHLRPDRIGGKTTMMGKRGIAACVVCLGFAIARPAGAAGFANTHLGGEYGNPVTTNPTALYYNPAGMAFSEGVDIMGDGQLAVRYVTWQHQAPPVGASDNTYAQVGNSGRAVLMNVFGGPAVGGTIKIGNLALGAGLFIPFGGRVYWNTNNAFDSSQTGTCGGDGICPLANDGVQRWHIINAQLQFIYVSVGAAYKLGPLAIGVTGNVIQESIAEVQAKTLRGNIDSTAENRGTLNVSGFSGSFAAGAMLEAIPEHLWIGGSYQAQPGLGPETIKGSLEYQSGQPPFYQYTGKTHYDVDFHQALPDIIRAGVRLRTSDTLELRLFGDITRWSKMTNQCVNQQDKKLGDACNVYPDGSTAAGNPAILANVTRNWNDSYGLRLGVSYWVRPEVEILGGLGVETAAVPDSTIEPGSPDAFNIAPTLGGRFRLTDFMYLTASYTHIQYLDRTVTNSRLATAANGDIVQLPTGTQDGNGTYQQFIGIFEASMEAKF